MKNSNASATKQSRTIQAVFDFRLRPHFGQLAARVLTSFPQSGQISIAIGGKVE